MQFRGVTRRGTLAFGGVTFTTAPRLYEMTSEEAATLQKLYGDWLSLEPLEPEPGEQSRPRSRRRAAAEEAVAGPDETPEEES